MILLLPQNFMERTQTMARLTRLQVFMQMAILISGQSTCNRANNGAILVSPFDCNPISTGYNGPPPGEAHCQSNQCPLINGGCSRSIHAEANAITRMNKDLWEIPKSLICTMAPCLGCARIITNPEYKVETVYFNSPYRKTEGVDFLLSHGLSVYKLNANGFVEDQETKQVWHETRPRLQTL